MKVMKKNKMVKAALESLFSLAVLLLMPAIAAASAVMGRIASPEELE